MPASYCNCKESWARQRMFAQAISLGIRKTASPMPLPPAPTYTWLSCCASGTGWTRLWKQRARAGNRRRDLVPGAASQRHPRGGGAPPHVAGRADEAVHALDGADFIPDLAPEYGGYGDLPSAAQDITGLQSAEGAREIQERYMHPWCADTERVKVWLARGEVDRAARWAERLVRQERLTSSRMGTLPSPIQTRPPRRGTRSHRPGSLEARGGAGDT